MSIHIKRTPSRALGTKIQELRTRQKISQTELARRAELHQSNIGRIERGSSNPNLETIARIAHALGTTVSEITEYITAPMYRAPDSPRTAPGQSHSAIGHSSSVPSG